MAVLKTAWLWMIVGAVLIVVGAVALDGGVGTIVVACGSSPSSARAFA